MAELTNMTCIPCRGGAPPATKAERKAFFPQISDWDVFFDGDSERLMRVFPFKSYVKGLEFASVVGRMAEEQDHHPAILIEWRRVTVTWWTHVINGLHVNDFISAAKTDNLYKELMLAEK